MILLIGEGGNENMSLKILEELQSMQEDVIWVDQNTLPVENNIYLRPVDGKITGEICFHNKITIDIDKFTGIYTRLDFFKTEQALTDLHKGFLQSERAIAIDTWLEHTDAIVVNPAKSQKSNSSKLYQTWIVQKYGFKVPDCLVTNDPDEARNFYNKYKEQGLIFKSASGERSIVGKVTEEEVNRFDMLVHCPTMLQSFVEGTDYRVHTLVTGEVFATEILSESSDYRYDSDRELKTVKLPDDLKKKCVEMTADLGLYLSGIDLRKTPDGDYYCFEVNPSPAFSWYEDQTGQPIANAVAKMLLKGKEFKKKINLQRRF
ncbi:MAG: RimK family alpha-L-glutamate ligase [Vampirovibrionia bacterium]